MSCTASSTGFSACQLKQLVQCAQRVVQLVYASHVRKYQVSCGFSQWGTVQWLRCTTTRPNDEDLIGSHCFVCDSQHSGNFSHNIPVRRNLSLQAKSKTCPLFFLADNPVHPTDMCWRYLETMTKQADGLPSFKHGAGVQVCKTFCKCAKVRGRV